MARSVYVTGIDRGDGRQVVELGVMELLTRQVDRVGVFRPLVHDGPDRLYELLRARYRLSQSPATVYGLDYHEASAVQAEKGTDELVSRLVDRFHQVAREYEAVLVLGSDFADTQLPDELALNARLANEFGASVIAVVGGKGQTAESVRAETRNAYRAYAGLGCDVLAMVVNRVAAEDRAAIAERLAARLPVPVSVLPDDPALSAPTVAQITAALNGTVLLGDDSGLARDALNFVFGGAMLPNLLNALTPGCMVVTPGDRADLVVGSLAAHSAGTPPIAGVLLTLDERPGEEILTLAARLAPGTPVVSVAGGSFPTAAELFTLEGKLNAATPRKAETALGLFERHVDTAALLDRISVARSGRVTPMMFEHELLEQARSDRKRVVLPEGAEERVLRATDVLLRRDVCDLTLLGDVDVIRKKAADLGIDLAETQLIDPHTSELRQTFARPAFEIIKTKPDASIVSSVFFMCLADKVLVYGDCAVNPDPNAEQLADIAVQSAVTAARFGVEPRVAMLSYSTGTSGSGADVDKVREATERVRAERPDLRVEGPIQYDAAVEPT
ncbi:AAA family ATPase, partial [Streptomyces sp. MBT72]|uniref:phosphate acyltransferase n=1 Tax=Streptomyces sp. MBT72 TaxID=1488402 RepID=UPI00191640F2